MASQTWPHVAIIVLTWNQRDVTLDCLDSLKKMDYPAECLDLIVVDNGSADGTAQAIRDRFEAVTVLENTTNLGFAAGNNVGIRYAMECGVDYIMLLNNDTIVATKMLTRLIDSSKTKPSVGIVTPKIYYYDEPERIWCAGASVNWYNGSSMRLQAEEIDPKQDTEPYYVDFASGCAICLKREVIDRIGLLDSRFFIYYEETDWCIRASNAGWSTLYVPTAYLWHKVSAAMGTTSPATDYYMNRNVLLFLAKNQRGWKRAVILLHVGIRSLMTIIAYTIKTHGGERIPNRNARLFALRDALLGRWGIMGKEVASICYPDHD